MAVPERDELERVEIFRHLRSTRESCGVLQRTVGIAMGVNQGKVSEMERQMRDCKISLLQSYAGALDLKLHVRLVPRLAVIPSEDHLLTTLEEISQWTQVYRDAEAVEDGVAMQKAHGYIADLVLSSWDEVELLIKGALAALS